MTKKQMDKLGIPYEEQSLDDHPDVVALFKNQGFTSSPIVTTDVKTWSGFRLDKINSLASYLLGEKNGR